MKYRADVDGLRAIAVLPVLFYHAGVRPFTGGFVGVDIFFVISGYLITGLIAEEIGQQRFSVFSFYERRIRRIFPALIVVIMGCFAISYLLLMPLDLKRFAASVVAVTIFASNLLFWRTAGYFDIEADLKPLLHTWSLAVEEQFYVIFPLFLILTLKFFTKRQTGFIIIVALLISFAISAWQVTHDPVSAFYLPISRAWELLLGALLAISRKEREQGHKGDEVFAVVGLGLIVFSITVFSAKTPFPGVAALLPCIGAALIIWSGESTNTIVARTLKLRVIVFSGLISYSLYLWHWPFIVFGKYYLMRNPNAMETAAMLAGSGLAAILSWRFVEAPFRVRGGVLRGGRGFIFATAAGSSILALSGALLVYFSDGLPQRLPADVRRLAMGAGDSEVGRSACDTKTPREVLAGNVCEIGDASGTPTFALLGDSIAISLRPAIASLAIQSHRSGVSLTKGGCYPLVGAVQYDDIDRSCIKFLNAAIRFVKEHRSISSVIISARWTSAAEGTTSLIEGMYITDEFSSAQSYDENKRVFSRSLERTIEAFAGRTIFVVSTIPEHLEDVPRIAALGKYLAREVSVDLARHDFDSREEFVRNVLNIMSERSLVHVFDLSQYLCNEKVCFGTKDGYSLYSDRTHLSRFGALAIEGVLSPVFSQ